MTKDAGQAQQTNRMGQPLSSYEAGYEAGYRDGAAALKAATERAEACAKAAQDDRETLLAAEVDIAALERKLKLAERELRDCDAARTLVLSENERLANELMAMRAGRKAEIEALQAKASLADEAYKNTIAVEEANTHLPSHFRAAAIRENMLRWLNRFDALSTLVSGAEQVADREATTHQST